MERQDDAILLSKNFFGERRCHGLFLTSQSGRWRVSLPKTLSLQPGDEGVLSWRAPSPNHIALGHYEKKSSAFSALLDNPPALLALKSACSLYVSCLSDQRSTGQEFSVLRDFLQQLRTFHPALYILFEREVLSVLGFGLDLTRCAVTGATTGLAFVSPKTGCAVSERGVGPYRDRLLPLPSFLLPSAPTLCPEACEAISGEDLQNGFALTRHFLERAVRSLHPSRSLPLERRMLEEWGTGTINHPPPER
ncbi:MAG: DNA repair protein RecO C-terminal domain-containing protein [Holosporales bacterium]|jgi:DNA repair protein RecO (recombination protein O)|nr:DNA repair protein RecO C-terminal domain-containing protein [Holosporales bacterium]